MNRESVRDGQCQATAVRAPAPRTVERASTRSKPTLIIGLLAVRGEEMRRRPPSAERHEGEDTKARKWPHDASNRRTIRRRTQREEGQRAEGDGQGRPPNS